MSQPQFKPGDRVFSHYTMRWGTIDHVRNTVEPTPHGVTGNMLPATTWYAVRNDDGGVDYLDDAHGEWDLARIVPPHIARRFGYGDDPRS